MFFLSDAKNSDIPNMDCSANNVLDPDSHGGCGYRKNK